MKTFAVISLRDCEERNKKVSDAIPRLLARHFTVATIPRSCNSSLYQILRTIRDTRLTKSVVKLRECRNIQKKNLPLLEKKKKKKKRLRQRGKSFQERVFNDRGVSVAGSPPNRGRRDGGKGRERTRRKESKGNTAGGLWFIGGFPSGTRTRKHRNDPVVPPRVGHIRGEKGTRVSARYRSNGPEELVYSGKCARLCIRIPMPAVVLPFAPFHRSSRPVGM